MLYPYAEFPGELSITYSQIMVDDNVKGGVKSFWSTLNNRQIMDLKKPDMSCLIIKKFTTTTLHLLKLEII